MLGGQDRLAQNYSARAKHARLAQDGRVAEDWQRGATCQTTGKLAESWRPRRRRSRDRGDRHSIMANERTDAMTAQSFTVTSPGSPDGAMLTRRNAASIGDCGGENLSPPLAWSPSPDGTRSHAVILYDPDGAKGLGSVHWVAYDLAAAKA